MSNFNRQIERESASVTKGVDRFYQQLKQDTDAGREMDGPVGQTLTATMMQKFVPVVETLYRECKRHLVDHLTTGRRIAPWRQALIQLPAPVLAYIAIRTCLTAGERRQGQGASALLGLASRIGRIANLELRWRSLRSQESERNKKETEPPYNRITYLLKETLQVNARSVRRALNKLRDIETEVWDSKLMVEVGMPLILLLLETLPEAFEVTTHIAHRFGRMHKRTRVELTAAARSQLTKDYKRYAEERPWLEPMVCPPLYWQSTANGWEGGYLKLCAGELFKDKALNQHTGTIIDQFPVPQLVLDALNQVQRTPWRVNPAVLTLCQQAHERGLTEVLPVPPAQVVPDPIPAEDWVLLTREEHGAIRNERRLIYDNNFRLASKRDAGRRQLTVAHDLRAEPEIFFPHNMDFRGRLYPLPQDLHPQADDMGKSLLMFAGARPLGNEGVTWLTYHAANCYGLDKLTRAEQVAWASTQAPLIRALADDPFSPAALDFWKAAEEPWQFLAAALDLGAAWATGNPAAYHSRLPVAVDGSCNGLQHLSGMGLDPVGAQSTNLTADPVRQDIYQIVADKVAEAIEEDARAGNEIAARWRGRVSRAVVKRGVMTVPYGLTPIGMRDQLINDGWTRALDGDHHANANYLRDLMRWAIADTVSAATQIMAWMQGNAELLSKNGKVIRWQTPAGLMVQQGYMRPQETRLYTIMGVGRYRRRTLTRIHEAGTMINVTKQRSSIVPNIIHSFDAAHLMLTMAAMPKETCVSAVHDSFGCHAADMPAFLNTIREQFVNIYKADWFTSLQADFLACRGTDDFPLLPPPTRGTFDIEEVRFSPFVFA